jgi:hypothetical protein
MTTSTAPTIDATTHQQAVLNDCVDLGHKLVRLVVAQAEANPTQALKAAPAYDRVTRSMRKSILLFRKLAEPVKTIDRTAARKRIIRTVEDAIQRETDTPEALHEELLDRLDTLDLEDEIGNRPVEDIIADIIHDLGLAASHGMTPWKRRTPADIAQLVARAAQPAAPTWRPKTAEAQHRR